MLNGEYVLGSGFTQNASGFLTFHMESLGAEVVAVELREAVRALAELRGLEVGDRVLDEVFARFCIGK